ncbi:MAG: hypothetical protein KKE73_05135 [Proteobacteria bacterium]|nr:hypothetical protein [Pseudomonadota bacterium]
MAPGFGPNAAMAASVVPMHYQLPENPSNAVTLSSEDRAAIADTLSGFYKTLAEARVIMRGFDIDPYLTENHTGRMTEFSLNLTLRNGSRLSSKPRKVPENKLGNCIRNCIRHCIGQYQKRVTDKESKLNLTNL